MRYKKMPVFRLKVKPVHYYWHQVYTFPLDHPDERFTLCGAYKRGRNRENFKTKPSWTTDESLVTCRSCQNILDNAPVQYWKVTA